MAERAITTIIMDFMDAISESTENSSQIMIVWRDPRWRFIRETLNAIKGISIKNAVGSVRVK